MTQRPVLGKGLASLLPPVNLGQLPADVSTSPGDTSHAASQATKASPAAERIPGITVVPVGDIEPNPYQPRREFDESALKELCESIKITGVIQPIVVRRTPSGLQLIAGERRWRAAQMAGLKQIPVLIRKSTDKESLEIALIENIQRQDLNCIDEALAYQQLGNEFQLTQEEVATRVGKERATVANFLRLLRLPEAVIDDLKSNKLSFGHGKALLPLEDIDQILFARQVVIEKKLSVRATEAYVEEVKKNQRRKEPGTTSPTTDALHAVQTRLDSLSTDLSKLLSTKVKIVGTPKKGKIVIEYKSLEELNRVTDCIRPPRG